MSRFRILKRGTATPSPTPSASVVYDTSIGNGVDTAGFADLPLRVGGTRYFVGNGGNDANTGLSHAQRLATTSAAHTKVTTGAGDQILIAEDSTFTAGLPEFQNKSGFSALYPLVFQSYDPADPLNEAKYGRASGSHRPQINTSGGTQQLIGGAGGPNYLVYRGLNWNPGLAAEDQAIGFLGNNNYILVENNIVTNGEFSFDSGDAFTGDVQLSPPSHDKIIIRNNAITYGWSSTIHIGGIYIAGYRSWTIEDNTFYHNGWKSTASRDDTQAAGGPTVFRHPFYAQDNSTAGNARRNLMFQSAADGGSLRGDGDYNNNLIIECPVALGLGGGLEYNLARPYGVNVAASYNVVMDSIDLNTANVRGQGFFVSNGKAGSAGHHNLFIHRLSTASAGSADGTGAALANAAQFNQASYFDYRNNIVRGWMPGPASSETYEGQLDAFPALSFTTYSNNYWDKAASGSNLNISSLTSPNQYTSAALYAALTATFSTVTDRASFIAYAIAYPEAHIQRTAIDLLRTGYGMSAPPADTTAPVLTSPTGTQTGSTTANLGVTTDEANGVLMWVVTTSSTAPTAAQIMGGQAATSAYATKQGSQAVTATGAQGTIGVTGLTTATTYYAHFMHRDDAGNQSAVSSSASFTTS